MNNIQSKGTIKSDPLNSKICVLSELFDYENIFTGSEIKVGTELRTVVNKESDATHRLIVDEVSSFVEQQFAYILPSISISDIDGVLAGFYNARGEYRVDKSNMYINGSLVNSIDSSGIVQLPKNSSVQAFMSTTQPISTSTLTAIMLNNVVYDQADEFNMSSFKFIPRVTGVYNICVYVAWDTAAWTASDKYEMIIDIGGQTRSFNNLVNSSVTDALTGNCSFTTMIAAWQEVLIKVNLTAVSNKILLGGETGTSASFAKIA